MHASVVPIKCLSVQYHTFCLYTKDSQRRKIYWKCLQWQTGQFVQILFQTYSCHGNEQSQYVQFCTVMLLYYTWNGSSVGGGGGGGGQDWRQGLCNHTSKTPECFTHQQIWSKRSQHTIKGENIIHTTYVCTIQLCNTNYNVTFASKILLPVTGEFYQWQNQLHRITSHSAVKWQQEAILLLRVLRLTLVACWMLVDTYVRTYMQVLNAHIPEQLPVYTIGGNGTVIL